MKARYLQLAFEIEPDAIDNHENPDTFGKLRGGQGGIYGVKSFVYV